MNCGGCYDPVSRLCRAIMFSVCGRSTRFFGTIGTNLPLAFRSWLFGVCTAVISGGLTGRMVKRFGEKRTLYIGQFFGSAGMFLAGLARTGAMLFVSIPIISLWNISMPAAQSMMTHRVNEREQGELQGALQSMRSITFIIGPGLVFAGVQLVHQSKTSDSSSRSPLFSRRCTSLHRDANRRG